MLALLKKHVVMIGVVIVAGGLLWYYFSGSSSSAPLLTSGDASGVSPASQQILTTLGSLRTIKLDDSIFSDPLFTSLSDFGVTIPPAAAGRRNPFAPVGQDSGPVSSSTSQ